MNQACMLRFEEDLDGSFDISMFGHLVGYFWFRFTWQCSCGWLLVAAALVEESNGYPIYSMDLSLGTYLVHET